MADSPIQLAVLISGSGTTLQNFIDCIADKSLNARIVQVIASRPGIAGIERAARAGLPCQIVDRKNFPSLAEFSRTIFDACEKAGTDLVCLAGWLTLLEIPPKWNGKVMNIHPALLPDFGGKGMYGKHVHEAVLKNRCKISGCTVHFVDSTYDTGPIILQRVCEVLDADTPDALAHRVFEQEKIAYPMAIELYRKGRLQLSNRQVRIKR